MAELSPQVRAALQAIISNQPDTGGGDEQLPAGIQLRPEPPAERTGLSPGVRAALEASIAAQQPQLQPRPPAVVPPADPMLALRKAATIGAAQVGQREMRPTLNEILASDQPLAQIASLFMGARRPTSVAAADPYGITAWQKGAGDMPVFMMGSTEDIGRGLFSRVEDVARNIPVKGVHPNKLLSLLKSGASQEEVAYRQLPEFLASKGNTPVTRAELQAHLDAHPAPFPQTKTLGGAQWSPELERAWNNREFGPGDGARPATPDQWVDASDRLTRLAQQWQRNGDARQANRYFSLAEEAMSMAEGVDHATGSTAGQTKYQHYTLPGGKNYRESLYTLPPEMKKQGQYRVEIRNPQGDVLWSGSNVSATDVERLRQRHEPATTVHATEIETPVSGFTSGHFDQPNIVVHARTTERTLPSGEPGRFIEEVQSDWHQAGKKGGYRPSAPAAPPQLRATPREGYWEINTDQGDFVTNVFRSDAATPEAAIAEAQRRLYREPMRTATDPRVPDAPFKETWPDLALKLQLLETAKNPEAKWIGFTSGATQAERYDLSKYIDTLQWTKWPRGGENHGVLVAFNKDGQQVMKERLQESQVADYVGKEAAAKLLAKTPDRQTGVREISGLDLQVGGEGMKHFYDQLLPKRLEKIVKQFGGTVERVPLTAGRTRDVIEAEINALMRHEATMPQRRFMDEYNRLLEERNLAVGGAGGDQGWIVRLTPEMKQRILKVGLPLMALPFAAAVTGNDDQKQ